MLRAARPLHGFQAYTSTLTRFADVLCMVGAGWIAYWLRFGRMEIESAGYTSALIVGGLLVLVIHPVFGIYKSWRGRLRLGLVAKLVAAYMMVGAAITALLFFTKLGANFSRLWLMYWIGGAAVASITIRLLAYPLLNRIRRQGRNRRRVLLVGDAHSCATAIRHLRQEQTAGFDPGRVIIVGDDPGQELEGIAYEPYAHEAPIEHDEDEVWICLPLSQGETVKEIQATLSLSTANVRYMPDMRDFRLINHAVSDVAGLYLLDLSCTPMTGFNAFIKAVEDRVIAALILLLISPIMIFVAVGVRLSSRGPIFYRQERVSWNGRPFMMLKFRSMPVDVEKNGVQWGGAGSAKKATPFGAFIRRTSLDELPQFINVLKGDMSIVGPRPERTVFVNQFKHEIPGYMQKHMVKAGITGWAQINGWRGDTDLQQRIECDLWYIENWSLWLDLKIIFLTVFKGFVNPNAY